MRKRFLFLPVAITAAVIHCQAQTTNPTDLYLQTSELNNTMVQYDADKGAIMRFYSTSGSQDGFGFRMGRNAAEYSSPERRQRLLKLAADYSRQLKELDFEKISINGQVDYILFKRNLEDDVYKLTEEQKTYVQVTGYFPFADIIYALDKPRRRGAEVKGQEVARILEGVRRQLARLADSLKKAQPIDMKLAQAAAAEVEGVKGLLRNYYNFYNGYDPLFTWWVPKTYTAVDSALGAYASLLRSKGIQTSAQKDDGSGIIGHPIGREELIRQLKLEFIPYTPEELEALANKEFAWCDAEALKAAREMGFGDDRKAALEKLKNAYVEPGRQPAAMMELYNQSVDFLKKNDLVTIPPLAEETWRMYMMSPERQLVSPFFLGGESLIVSYPTNTMSYDEKMMSMRGNNPFFSRATIHHELIAGHHLQQFMEGRYKTYRHFETPFWVEGNSLYWEMLLWDLHFPRSPEERLGMLFWRMHRCARIIFSLNYHLGKWTPQQCIDFLVDRVGHERANAEGEVRRSFTGGYGPLYQIAYMIGGLQFMALKRELVDTHKMSYRQYHDAILHENSMPVEMLRAILTKQTLKRDFVTQWRFYDK
ncbi:MAG: DUF885 family protein [Bacteroidetes bacterium]|nr:DUF885 family protein [Bacteroidota bacterium]